MADFELYNVKSKKTSAAHTRLLTGAFMQTTPFPQHAVLLVDDEEQFLLSAEFALQSEGLDNVTACADSRTVMDLLARDAFSVVLLDLYMPGVSGLDLLPEITREHPEIPVVILTAVNELETAVECMRQGAFDYIVKPVRRERLVTVVRRALERSDLQREIGALRDYLLTDSLRRPEAFADIVTADCGMRSLFRYIEAVAETALPVLLTGETGVGKELFARAVHAASGRSGVFVTVNAAGVDDTLFSDTLFGHRRGAFTGADRDRRGLIEEAAGGTLFLDEIGDLCLESQVKLLRLLQEHTYYTLGEDLPKRSDARIVAATNRDLPALRDDGRFRKDLYYRLSAHHVRIPPLRERRDDLPLLLRHLLEKAASDLGRRTPTVPRELVSLLGAYHFPGNVRELEGMVYDAVSRHRTGVLSMESFREKMDLSHETALPTAGGEGDSSGRGPDLIFPEQLPTLRETEDLLISEALRRADGNQTIAARLLGISRSTLNSRLNRDR